MRPEWLISSMSILNKNCAQIRLSHTNPSFFCHIIALNFRLQYFSILRLIWKEVLDNSFLNLAISFLTFSCTCIWKQVRLEPILQKLLNVFVSSKMWLLLLYFLDRGIYCKIFLVMLPTVMKVATLLNNLFPKQDLK